MPRPSQSNALLLLQSGSHQYLGTLVSGAGATINNSTTATPFAIPTGAVLLVQASAQCFFRAGTTLGQTASGTFTANDIGVSLGVNEKRLIMLKDAEAFIAAAGPAAFNLAVWRLD